MVFLPFLGPEGSLGLFISLQRNKTASRRMQSFWMSRPRGHHSASFYCPNQVTWLNPKWWQSSAMDARRGAGLGPVMLSTAVVNMSAVVDRHKVSVQTLSAYMRCSLANSINCPKSKFSRKSVLSVKCKKSLLCKALLDTNSGLWPLCCTEKSITYNTKEALASSSPSTLLHRLETKDQEREEACPSSTA